MGHRSIRSLVPAFAALALLVAPGAPSTSAAAAASGAGTVRAAAAPPPGAQGYWLAGADGAVFRFGDVAFFGSTGTVKLAHPVVGMASHPVGNGYWLVASDGGVFSFGNARFFGSTGAVRLNRPIVGMAATESGNGYWLVASDGGIFTFGDAPFLGSTGAVALNQPIVGMARRPGATGYWMVASDGGIFSFGDAPFFGSTGAVALNQPIVAMSPTPSGNGYWLVASDGGIFSFGDAPFFGSTGAVVLNQPIVGMAATPSGGGYWLTASDGGIFSFGDARFRGSAVPYPRRAPIVTMATGPAIAPYVSGTRGYDISWPQCGKPFPAEPYAFAIVGVTNGRPFTQNPCLAEQVVWAEKARPSAYIVLTGPNGPQADTGPAGTCAPADLHCRSYNWGWNAAAYSVDYAISKGLDAEVWWLDIERADRWSVDKTANARVIQASIDYLQSRTYTVGIYSAPALYPAIAGDYKPGLPIWIGGAPPSDPASYCTNTTKHFAGGTPWLTQWVENNFDNNYAC